MKEQLMADGDTVKMKLTFWRDGKQPGDIVEVPADEVHRWKGFAEPVSDSASSADTATPTSTTGAYPKPTAQPADNAKVDDWRAYAISLGMDQAKADKATKAELQDWARDAGDRA